jgi:hypothetical protein
MYYTRAVADGRIRRMVSRSIALLMITTPIAARQPASYDAVVERLVAHREVLTIGQHKIDVTFLTNGHSRQQLIDAATSGLTRLHEWLGPLPARELTIVDAPWRSGLAGAAFPGVAITSTRWLSTSRDFPMERQLLAALARQYGFAIGDGGAGSASFRDAVALYLGNTLIHRELQNRQFLTPRFFGGFVPFSLRSLLIAPDASDPRPRLRHLSDGDEGAHRGALALHTFERLVGWPMLQQILAAFFDRARDGESGPSQLAAIASQFLGRDVSPFFAHALDRDRRIDYRIDQFATEPVSGEGYRTTVVAARTTDAALAGIAVPVLLRFADGSDVFEQFEDRHTEQRLEYRSPSPASMASVDPDASILLDDDRSNNTRRLAPPRNVLGIRLALHWVMWLQNAMLTYGAVL